MYFRALFDRIPHSKDEVNFKKGDILFVTDTMYNGHMGCWRACLVNEEDAQKRDIGMIPSRMKYVFIVNHHMRNFCNLIGLEQWYFGLI